MTAAPFSALGAPAVETHKMTAWRRFFTAVFTTPMHQVDHEVAEYLARHQHDLPPALRIELERRWMGP